MKVVKSLVRHCAWLAAALAIDGGARAGGPPNYNIPYPPVHVPTPITNPPPPPPPVPNPPPITNPPPPVTNPPAPPPPVQRAPEPGTLALGLIGAGVAGIAARRKRQQG